MKTGYKTTIGLEIHAELKTQTKMFCGCANLPETEPNTNICPICLAHPGTLPNINKQAVEHILRIGYALGGTTPEKSHFDRKSYFYPDLPKGYQISQYEDPLVTGGELTGVAITRVHLEEDTAGLKHTEDGSYVDFNRAGLPLMELVTEPVIGSADTALAFARELQLILRYLKASDADMEKGQMRIEANVSLAPKGELGTKVELKNINSFKAVKNAIAYEIKRQERVLAGGGGVVQETRGWNEVKGETFSQRVKEDADDYRYMPEPDLPPLDFTVPDGIDLGEVKRSVPELPAAKRERFVGEFSLPAKQVDVLVGDRYTAQFFEEAVSELRAKEKVSEKALKLLANYLTSDVAGFLNERGESVRSTRLTAENFAELIVLIEGGDISSRVAKDVLREMVEKGSDPDTVLQEKGVGGAVGDAEMEAVIAEVVGENEKAVADYKSGKETALKFLIGQAIAKLRGRGDPKQLETLLKKHLK